MDREARAARLRPVVQAAVDRSSIRDVAEEIGVPHTTLSHFLKGGVPRNTTLNKVAHWAERVEAVTHAADLPMVSAATVGEEREALGVFGSFDEIARQLRGIAPPGQAKARKRDALEGLRRTAADFGWPLPDWWYRLKELVDEDQI